MGVTTEQNIPVLFCFLFFVLFHWSASAPVDDAVESVLVPQAPRSLCVTICYLSSPAPTILCLLSFLSQVENISEALIKKIASVQLIKLNFSFSFFY